MKTRGDRLKERRKELGLTLREVGEHVGISIAGVRNIELGDVMPALSIGVKLAEILGKSIYWVLDGDEIGARQKIPIVGDTKTGPDRHYMSGDKSFIPAAYIGFDSTPNKIYALNCVCNDLIGFTYGDVLLVSYHENLVYGENVVVVTNGGDVMVRRLARVEKEAGEIHLDNIDISMKRTVLKITDIKFINMIVGSIRSTMVNKKM
ncbi:helix-turn-helix domain-containing protein [Xenorhabdus bovienii]|uniref:helix-turn-helix domain-containing protein n=1 Tax=Xenorhabdus bovienii TaxID=40576 RepID=UPI0023B33B1A|nr:helix-turn-helix domain-containing protein [Xenorhabdus bovienii]MDE9557004.1 helix-turn-helix domain-containing protein [Xenorhabdus bovienii]